MAASKSKTAKARPSSPLGRLGLIAVPGEELEKNRQRLSKLKQEVADLRESLRNAEVAAESLTATSADLTRCKEDLNSAEERILGQDKDILQLTSTIHKLEWEARRHNAEREEWEHHLAKVRKELKEKEARLTDAEEAKQTVEERVTKMESALGRGSEQLRRAEAELREREVRLHQMSERMASIERECAEARVLRDAAVVARERSDADMAAVQRQLSAQVVVHRREVDEMRAAALTERADFEKRFASLEEDHRRRAAAASAEAEKRVADAEARASARVASASADVAARVVEVEAERKRQVAAWERSGREREAEFATRASHLAAQWEGRLAGIEEELQMEREWTKTARLAAQNAESRMQGQTRDTRAQLAELGARLEEALQRGAELDAERARADMAVMELKERLKTAESARETADVAIQDLTQRLRASQQACQEKTRAKAEAEDRALHLETRALPGLRSELAETAALLRSQQKQSAEAAASAERINTMLRKSLKDGDARLAEAYHRIAELEIQLRATPGQLATRQLTSSASLTDSFRSPLRSPRAGSPGGPPRGLSGGLSDGATSVYHERPDLGLHSLRVTTPPPRSTPTTMRGSAPYGSPPFDRQANGVSYMEADKWQPQRAQAWDGCWSSQAPRRDLSSETSERSRAHERTLLGSPLLGSMGEPHHSLFSLTQSRTTLHRDPGVRQGGEGSLWKRVEKKCEEMNKAMPIGTTTF